MAGSGFLTEGYAGLADFQFVLGIHDQRQEDSHSKVRLNLPEIRCPISPSAEM
jgi:hypothetical protein